MRFSLTRTVPLLRACELPPGSKSLLSHTEEFQIIYVEAPPFWSGNLTSHSLSWALLSNRVPKTGPWKGQWWKGGKLQWRNLANVTLAGWSRLTSSVINRVDILCTFDMMWWEGHFISVVFLPKTHNPSLTMRKTSEKAKLKGILQTTWLVLFKIVKIIKNKESKRNCNRPEELNETWQLNVMWCPYPAAEKGH